MANAVTTAPYRYRARVLLHQPAGVIAGRLPPTVGVVEPAGPDRCLLTTGADPLDALAFHLAMLDAEFTVLEPPELAERVGVLGRRLLSGAPDPGRRPGRCRPGRPA